MDANAKKLNDLLGFDPAKATSGTEGALKEALNEIQAERAAENKGKAKELLKKAMELRSKMEKARRDFKAADSKFEKELGKVLNTIEAMARGTEVPEQEAAEAAPQA